MSGAARRAALAATASVVVALALSGCGTDEGNLNGTMKGGRGATASSPAAASPTASATDHDQADLTFALTMLPHHLQAEEMAGLVETRSGDERLRALATGIATAQHAQVEQLTSLLGAWGAAPDSALSDSEHLGGADGMMTDTQLSALGELSGEAFRTEWLRMMIAHHEGAVALASTELASGSNPQARALATSVLAAQQAEIDQMQGMLAG
jgi:uncharacterized protein (DUF305 family)